jgi:CHAT domain-containing protein
LSAFRSAPKPDSAAVAEFASLDSSAARRRWLQANRWLHTREGVNRLYEEVLAQAGVDLTRADRLTRAIAWIAARLQDDFCRAQGLRATAHVLYARAKYDRALAAYRQAAALFRRVGAPVEVGRTLSSALQTLIYLGRYSKALAWARQARDIFAANGDALRLARLDSNVGNILYRQDRFQEAMTLYQRAFAELRRIGGSQDVAAVLSNIAVCYISLQDFPRAQDAYREAREWCVEHGLPLLVAEADYNIAYLYYLRGEYTHAIELYQAARVECRRLGDAYHQALCDLDQSEMYLELNLAEQGAQFARSAHARFRRLGMRYERAKAQTFLAISAGQRDAASESVRKFRKARALFVAEGNRVWPVLIDLYCALAWHREGRAAESRRLAVRALRAFVRRRLPAKAALCELLLAGLNLEAGRAGDALRRCHSALHRLETTEAPTLRWQVWFLIGQVAEARSDRRGALIAYRSAHSHLERLRSRLRGQELKIAFLKDKLAVYESLVWICLEGGPELRDPAAAFGYVEQAKSRSLADLIASGGSAVPGAGPNDDGQVQAIRVLRERLNWCYREIEQQETRSRREPGRLAEDLRRSASDLEAQLALALTEVQAGNAEFAELQTAVAVSLDSIRAAIPESTMLVEFYQARETIHVCLVTKCGLEVVRLGAAESVRCALRFLQFQLSKFRLEDDYFQGFAPSLHDATDAHLHELYHLLIAPIRNKLKAKHLVFVPHGFLHYLPFHALGDGDRSLCDDFSISYVPSASVFALCRSKEKKFREESLVLGVPDPATTHIVEEVRAVAATLPGARLYIGADATASRLHELGPTCRFVHIATHGFFRQENPMFSSIRLGDSNLSVFDLYHLNLSAELVALSGCGTGLNTIVGGDEQVGLVRGILYAGAHAVLVSLWDVNDRTTAEFMKIFYAELSHTTNSAVALQRAMGRVRSVAPHPYYWAPFELVGDPAPRAG